MLLNTAAQNSLALKKIWETIDTDSCPGNYNFHMHTVCSDGQLTPEQLMGQAVKIGLKAMAITDHHSVCGYHAARNWLENIPSEGPFTSLPHLWTGLEVTAQLLRTKVHILGYGFIPEHRAMAPYLQGEEPQGKEGLAEEAIAAIHQAGGLAVLAHPARYRRPSKQLIPAAAELGIDGVEAYYAYTNTKPWTPSPIPTQEVKQLSREYGLFATCGTDTHGLNLLYRL
ncbi:MAG: PHP domain-containing protein [Prochloron sp. SP5CPC1]|nr:PHP domain-containing protein [Candidatus Paraprochloron terpiosi SP5CPC1]